MGDMDSFGTGAATGPRGGKMRTPAPSSVAGSKSKPQDQINSVITEWKYPPQMIMVAKDPGTVAMLTGLGVGKIKSHAKKVFFHVLEDYREQGAAAILRMYEVMSHFHFYNHKQQDLWIAHFFLELNLYLDYLCQQKEEMEPGADYLAVKCSIPPLMLHTNMGLATAVSYAARQPHGLKIMEFLIEDQNIFNDILGAAEDSDRYRIQNLRSGVNYGMATQLYPKEQISQESEMARSSGRPGMMGVGGSGKGTTIAPISVQSALWVASVRANILVVKWLLERLGVTGGEPSLFDLTPLEAANIAKNLHAGPDITNKDSNYYDNLVTIIPMLSRAAKTPKPKSSSASGSGGRRPHPAAMGGGAAEFGAGITGVNYPNPYYRDPRGGSSSSSGGGVTGIGDRGGGGGGGYPGYQDDEPEDDGIVTVAYATSSDYYDSMRTAGGGAGGSSSSRSSTSYLSGGGGGGGAKHRHHDSSSSSSSGRTHSSSGSNSGRPPSRPSGSGSGSSSSKKPPSGGGGGGNPDYFPREFYGQ